MSPIIVSLHLEFILRCHLLNLRVSRQHCDSSELKQRTGIHYTCFSRKSCIDNNFFHVRTQIRRIELNCTINAVMWFLPVKGMGKLETSTSVSPCPLGPSSFFRQVNLTQIAMMGISSAYRHHGDLHVAGIYFSSMPNLCREKPNKQQKQTQSWKFYFILDRID